MEDSSKVFLFSVIFGVVFIGIMLFLGRPETEIVLPLKIEEFSDYQCPFCATYIDAMEILREDYQGKVEFSYHHFPINELHPRAFQTSVAAEAAREQDAFFEYSELLYENQDKTSDDDFFAFAEELELDVEKFKSDYNDNPDIVDRVNADLELAKTKGINSTPTFIINDKKVPSEGAEKLIEKIDSMIAKAVNKDDFENSEEEISDTGDNM